MTKRRAGIFDPWRQESPVDPVVTLPEPLLVDATVGDDVQQPVRFAGRRAGVSVWLLGDNRAVLSKQAQTNVLTALLALKAKPALAATFATWGIQDTVPQTAGVKYTTITDGVRTVIVRGEGAQAMDSVALAFREAARLDPDVQRYLLSLGIRAYAT